MRPKFFRPSKASLAKAVVVQASLALVLSAALIAPALAAPTARVSGGSVVVRTGPGSHYPAIGQLPDGTEVVLDACTRNDRWCHITDTGWVLGSYLVGWAAKIPVTPSSFSGPVFGPDEYGFGYRW